MMVHISDSTRQLLELYENFVIEERGFIDVKVQCNIVKSPVAVTSEQHPPLCNLHFYESPKCPYSIF